MSNKKLYKKKGMQIAVSAEAHEKMRTDGYKAKPRRNLRAQVNFINKLDITL